VKQKGYESMTTETDTSGLEKAWAEFESMRATAQASHRKFLKTAGELRTMKDEQAKRLEAIRTHPSNPDPGTLPAGL
jgi:hypothetical protein